MQVDLYNGHKTAVAIVEVLKLALGPEKVMIFGQCGPEKLILASMLVAMHLLLVSYSSLRIVYVNRVVSLASVKSRLVFTFLVPAHPGSPGKGPLNGCYLWSVTKIVLIIWHHSPDFYPDVSIGTLCSVYRIALNSYCIPCRSKDTG